MPGDTRVKLNFWTADCIEKNSKAQVSGGVVFLHCVRMNASTSHEVAFPEANVVAVGDRPGVHQRACGEPRTPALAPDS